MAWEASDFRLDLTDQLRITRKDTAMVSKDMTRDDLNTEAEKLGLNPEDYANKDEIIEAIRAAESDDDTGEQSADLGSRVQIQGGEYQGRYAEVVGQMGDDWRVRLDGGRAVTLTDEDLFGKSA